MPVVDVKAAEGWLGVERAAVDGVPIVVAGLSRWDKVNAGGFTVAEIQHF